jgi:hypothetical protein
MRRNEEAIHAARAKATEVRRGARFMGAPSADTRYDFDAMVARAGRDDLVPWPPSVTRSMARAMWQRIEAFINGPEPRRSRGFDYSTAWRETRRLLDGILQGVAPTTRPNVGRAAHVPLWLILRPDGAIYWRLHPAEGSSASHGLINEIGGTCLTLLWSRDVRPLLKRCAACGRYLLLGRRTRRPGAAYLCGDSCRRQKKAARDSATNAERQRRYRDRLFNPKNAERQ